MNKALKALKAFFMFASRPEPKSRQQRRAEHRRLTKLGTCGKDYHAQGAY